MEKVSLKHIASEIGVSIATVSRALSRNTAVNPVLRRRIIELAAARGYINRQKRRKPVIALIIAQKQRKKIGAYFSALISLFSLKIYELGYAMELVMADDIELLKDSYIRGAISLAPNDKLESIWSENFSIPLVCINSQGANFRNTYSVSSDDKQGIKMAFDYLVENGHEKIALVTYGEALNRNNIIRAEQIFLSAKEHRLGNKVHHLHLSSDDNCIEMMAKLLKKKVTAIISSGEDMSVYIAYILELMDKKVPEEISLISFERTDVSRYLNPPHTTLEQDFEKLCELAINTCEDIALQKSNVKRNLAVEYKLNIRESVNNINAPL
jgi:DNA-binding LacI/PurR family transcriptional regulator